MSERKTPRTDAEAYELEGEYVVGYNAAKQLEIETQELAEALKNLLRVSRNLRSRMNPPEDPAGYEEQAHIALAAHKARQP